jgi:hypothetical protein
LGPKPSSQFYLSVELKLKSKPNFLIIIFFEKKIELKVNWEIVVGFGPSTTTKHVPIPLHNPLEWGQFCNSGVT